MIKLELPVPMFERINEIVAESQIFENHQDVIVHAITDILEQYDKK